MTAPTLAAEVERAEEITRQIYAVTGNLELMLGARLRRNYRRSCWRWTR